MHSGQPAPPGSTGSRRQLTRLRLLAGAAVGVMVVALLPAQVAMAALPTWPSNPNWQSLVPAPTSDNIRAVAVAGEPAHAPAVLGEQGLVTVRGVRELGGLIAYREGMCEHLDIVGACPATAEQVVLGASMAAQLGVGPGDTVGLTGSGRRVSFTVVGVYRPNDLDGTYWVETGLLANPASYPAGQFTSTHGDAIFTTDDGVRRVAPQVLDVSYQVVVPVRDIADRSAGGFASRLAATEAALTRSGYTTRAAADSLARLIARDRSLATGGIGGAAAQVLLLGWFCLYWRCGTPSRTGGATSGC